MPLRVKEKSSWKSLQIPEDILNGEDFSGLVDIQELTDYDLVSQDLDSLDARNGKKNKLKKSQKRKREIEDEELAEKSKSKKRKRRKKGTKSEDGESEEDSNSSEAQTEKNNAKANDSLGNAASSNQDKINLPSKKKSKSKLNVWNVEDIDIVTGEETLSNSEERSLSDQANSSTDSNKKSKRNKRKKKKESKENQSSLEAETGSQHADKTNASSSLSNKQTKKKRKRRRKKKEAQKTDSPEDQTLSDEEGVDFSDIDMSEWKDLYVPEEILKALQERKFTSPTVIQRRSLPSAIRDRKDILGAAETGSGKTLAFGIPLISRILDAKRRAANDEEDEDEIEEEIIENEDIEEDDEIEEKDDIDENGDEVEEENEDSEDEEMEEDEDGKEESDDDEIKEGEDIENVVSGDKDEAIFKAALPKKKSKKKPPMALILEPTRELAVQVKKHLMAISKYTDIRFANIVGGMSVEKQRRVLGKSPEVIIATPGRIWQLIEEGNEHLSNVDRILCLVLDEADRMIEKGHYEELTKLLELINRSPRKDASRQTFVMSATLTMDISAPKRLMNKKKKGPKDEDKIKSLIDTVSMRGKPEVIDLTPDDKVAKTLTELRVNCKADEKDFYLYYIVAQHPGRTLVFVNSKDCLRRLINVFTLLQCSPLPLHADMHQRQRLKNLDKFSENSKALLVASDVAARGLDIPGVDHVIHYQVPRTMENYVHRSGRTARASKLGLSVMLVGPEDAKDYRKIVYGVRNGEDLPLLPIEMDLLPAVRQRVALARELDVKEYRMKKKRVRNNFFIKAAEEMDMLIDDSRLLEDMGDSSEQADAKQELASLRTALNRSLQGSLAPLRLSKYPTKSGGLAIRARAELFTRR